MPFSHGSIFLLVLLNLNHEKHSLYHSGDLYYSVAVRCFRMECNRFDSYPYSTCGDLIAIWNHKKSIGFSIQSFSYTRSILSARLQFSTVAIFFKRKPYKSKCETTVYKQF